MIYFVRKRQLSKDRQWWVVAAAGILSLISFFVMMHGYGVSQEEIMTALLFFYQQNEPNVQLLLFMLPIVLCGLATAMAFRAGVFILAAEGQFLAGLMAATFLLEWLMTESDIAITWWGGILLLTAGLSGMVLGLCVGVLRRIIGVHEIMSSVFLIFLFQYIFSIFLNGIDNITGGDGALINLFMQRAPWVLLVIGLLAMIINRYHMIGFMIRAIGYGRHTIIETGYSGKQIYWFILLTGGLLAGMAGAVVAIWQWHQWQNNGEVLFLTFQDGGYLWLALALQMTVVVVIYMGRLVPIGVIMITSFFAWVWMALIKIDDDLTHYFFLAFLMMNLFWLLLCDFINRYSLNLDDWFEKQRIKISQASVVETTTNKKVKSNKKGKK